MLKIVNASTRETLPGIPTPMLASEGGGPAYFVPNPDPRPGGAPGVWYLHDPDHGYVPKDGSPIVRVRVVNEPERSPFDGR